VNKAELIDALAVKINGSKKQAAEAVEAVFDAIQHAVAAGEKVAITGFGVFEKADRAARTARNPRTGATVKVKATSVPKFRAGSEFKAVVAGKRKAAAKKAPAKKALAKKAPVRKAAPVKKAVAKKAPVRKAAPAKKAVAKKAPARKAVAKKAPARKAVAKKAPAKKAAARR
jgi:DNA-binding protein HU-beta